MKTNKCITTLEESVWNPVTPSQEKASMGRHSLKPWTTSSTNATECGCARQRVLPLTLTKCDGCWAPYRKLHLQDEKLTD